MGQSFFGDGICLQEMCGLSSLENVVFNLQKCRQNKDIAYAKQVYLDVCFNGLEAYTTIGNYLVPTFVDCGYLCDAQQVFHRMVHQNEHAWTSLMQGYIECGDVQHAFSLHQRMKENSIDPSEHTYGALMKACSVEKCLERGQALHADVVKEGSDSNTFIANTLIDMYAKCGSHIEAQEVFNDLEERDTISWNTLLTGYIDHGLAEEALRCLEHMELEGMTPNDVTFLTCLKACSSLGAKHRGYELHAETVKKGYERCLFLENALVDMYVKCKLLPEAEDLFQNLASHNVVSWNVLIAGCADNGLNEEALHYLGQMDHEGVSPNAITFLGGLKACTNLQAMLRGSELLNEIIKRGLEEEPFVGSALVDMYVEYGLFEEATKVFEKITFQHVGLWTALLGGYAEHGLGEEALKCLDSMVQAGICPNAVTYIFALKTCALTGFVDKGYELHVEVVMKGYENESYVGNSLIDMYVKLGLISLAEKVFDALVVQDEVSWNLLIAGYAENSSYKNILKCLKEMSLAGVTPNVATYLSSLKACNSGGGLCMGQEVHFHIIREALEKDTYIGNALVDMYARCGSYLEAVEVFHELPMRDVFSWNALIVGYSGQNLNEKVTECLHQMNREGISPDEITFGCSLRASDCTGSINMTYELHSEMVKRGYENGSYAGNILVDIYMKCSRLEEARVVFDRLNVQSMVSWILLITGYREQGLGDEALHLAELMQVKGFKEDLVSWNMIILVYTERKDFDKCLSIFAQLQEQGLIPDSLIYNSVVKACESKAALKAVRKLHAQICKASGCPDLDTALVTALIQAYCKTGNLSEAEELFDDVIIKDLLVWDSLILGYARQGQSEHALELFERMLEEGIDPDEVSFLNIFTACSHVGSVEKAQKYFDIMCNQYGISPNIKLLSCLVDIYGRAGQMKEAVAFVKNMPLQPDPVMWRTLLAACAKWDGINLAIYAFKCAVRLDHEHSGAYVLMSNFYLDDEMGEDTEEIEETA